LRFESRQQLIFDADDTLWENNIYFEQAFDEFVDFLDHSSLDARQVRDILDELEAANAKIHGYGSHRFGKNLQEVYQHLAEREIREEDLRTVMGFAERILEAPMELMPGVRETLDYLVERHELSIFTKGNPDEQRMKIDRSGLLPYFAHAEVTKEKNPEAYRQLVETRGMPHETTWMIGNSPKSDINASMAIGLNAVYVPHERTWILERAEIQPGRGHLLRVERFSDLLRHF
jgi:putative hydrolase of the HAD superfamily